MDTIRRNTVGEIFDYRPLIDAYAEIRIVHLFAQLALTPEGDYLPRCELEHVPFDHSTEYSALSYAWGDLDDTTNILLEGKKRAVTRNLSAFLYQTAHGLKRDNVASCPLWIDAICINQDDHFEKSQQVQLMGKIFSGAAHVTIWLGPSSKDSDLAFQFLVQLGENYVEVLEQLQGVPTPKSPDTAGRLLSIMHDHYNETMKPLCVLLDLPWWKRLWVQQEVSLSRIDNLVMVCGDSQISWTRVVLAHCTILHVMRYSMQWRPSRTDLSPERLHGLRVTLSWCYQMMLQTCRNSYPQIWRDDQRLDYSLAERLRFNAISRSGRMEASLPVDHVYSLLGISSDVNIQPDYARSTGAVFVEVAEYLLHKIGAKLLAFCDGSRPNAFGLPSWAPDWSSLQSRVPLSPNDRRLARHHSSIFNASGTTSDFSYRVLGLELELKGVEVDTVDSSGLDGSLFQQLPADASMGKRDTLDWPAAFHGILVSEFGDSNGSFNDVLWRTPIADEEIAPGDLTTRAGPSLRHSFQQTMAHRHSSESTTLSVDTIKYGQMMASLAMNRMAFVSRSRLIGLGPNSMAPGDKVFIILGKDVPIVLRGAGEGRYRIVGEALVHGIMGGELMEQDPKIETLTII